MHHNASTCIVRVARQERTHTSHTRHARTHKQHAAQQCDAWSTCVAQPMEGRARRQHEVHARGAQPTQTGDWACIDTTRRDRRRGRARAVPRRHHRVGPQTEQCWATTNRAVLGDHTRPVLRVSAGTTACTHSAQRHSCIAKEQYTTHAGSVLSARRPTRHAAQSLPTSSRQHNTAGRKHRHTTTCCRPHKKPAAGCDCRLLLPSKQLHANSNTPSLPRTHPLEPQQQGALAQPATTRHPTDAGTRACHTRAHSPQHHALTAARAVRPALS
jgi:hypothetical protein